MGMSQTRGIEKESKGDAAIVAYTIAKMGSDDDHTASATAVTEGLIGVFQHATDAAEETVRLMLTGITRVELGGTVAAGDRATSDANAKAVKAAPTAGVNNSTVGMFLGAGVVGDIVPMLLGPGQIQGA